VESEKAAREGESTWREVGSLIVALGIVGVLGFQFVRGQLLLENRSTPMIVDVKTTTDAQLELCGPPRTDGRPVAITMLYSDDKRPWIEHALDRFSQLCPFIQVKLTAMADIASADAILSGTQEPMLWAPADDIVLEYLDARWKRANKPDKPVFDATSRVSLVQSPLVMLIWNERLQAIDAIMAQQKSEQGAWATLICPMVPAKPALQGVALVDMVPGTWGAWYDQAIPAPQPTKKPRVAPRKAPEPKPEDTTPVYRAPLATREQIRSWGRVKFAHASPSHSAAGLEALYLMAYDYLVPLQERTGAAAVSAQDPSTQTDAPSGLQPTDINKNRFQRAFDAQKQPFASWLRRCEAGLEAPSSSAGQLTSAMIHVGESRYDAVVTYEHLTFDAFERINDFPGVLSDVRIIYPQPTIMNSHPVVFLNPSDTLTDVQKLYAHKWLAYLRSEEMQRKSIEYGFRPAIPQISIRSYESDANPFMRLRRYGVRFDLDLAEPPRLDPGAIHELIQTWKDATGRN
jgi:hypothetical protein